jgi:hypothetical protein
MPGGIKVVIHLYRVFGRSLDQHMVEETKTQGNKFLLRCSCSSPSFDCEMEQSFVGGDSSFTFMLLFHKLIQKLVRCHALRRLGRQVVNAILLIAVERWAHRTRGCRSRIPNPLLSPIGPRRRTKTLREKRVVFLLFVPSVIWDWENMIAIASGQHSLAQENEFMQMAEWKMTETLRREPILWWSRFSTKAAHNSGLAWK